MAFLLSVMAKGELMPIISYFECMLCGHWHKDGSNILLDHVHRYYKAGGTFSLSEWHREDRLVFD